MQKNNYMDIMEKNHMEIPWHDYTENDSNVLINKAGLIEKASVIGRVGLIMLSCGTGAWRVRTSMNRLAKELGVTCTVDVGLMSIEFNCFDGKECVSQSLSIANTGVNTSKLYRMEQFVDNFPKQEAHLTGEEIHRRLDEIESIHTLYSPAKLGLAAALACCAFTFLLGGGPIEMVLAFIAAGIGNVIRTKLIKHHAVFLLVDIRHDPSANDKMMYDWILHNGYQPIIIATKLDKLKRSQVQKNIKAIREGLKLGKDGIILPFSAETKQGREEIWALIDELTGLVPAATEEVEN